MNRQHFRRMVAKPLFVLFICGFIFFVGFQVGIGRFAEQKAEEKELVLKQLIEAKAGTPENTEAILKLTRLDSQTGAKEKSVNFWLTLLPSVLIAIDILLHLFKKKPAE